MRPSVLNSKLLSHFLIEKDTNKEIIGVNFNPKKIQQYLFKQKLQHYLFSNIISNIFHI